MPSGILVHAPGVAGADAGRDVPRMEMSVYHVLLVGGPALTTLGAGLLAYDVLRGPLRLNQRRDHQGVLDAAGRRRDASAEALSGHGSTYATAEHETHIAALDASHQRVVDYAQAGYDDAEMADRARAFRLAVWGLALVVLGGACETVTAVLTSVGSAR